MTETLPVTSGPVEGVGAFPLSFQQEFLRMVDHADGNGPFGPRYTIVGGWRVRGPLDLDTLRGALYDLVVRHETLRTELVFDGEHAYQRVLPPSPGEVVEVDLSTRDGERDEVAEDFDNEVEAGEFGIEIMPHIRLVVGRFDPTDAVVVLVAHHTAVDGWSAQIVMRDLAAYYTARRFGGTADLPQVRQLRDYVRWQRDNATGPAVTAAREFWRENLRGARMVALPTDHPRPEHGPFVTGWHRFLIERELRAGATALASQTKSTVFMVLLAVYLTYLRELTGKTDLVVPTFTPGRHPAWILDTVGSFYNFLPLRTDISGCADIRDVIARVRATCLAAYTHEIPFLQLIEEAPELMDDVIVPSGACCVFQAVQMPNMMYDEQVGDLRWSAMRRRVRSAEVGSQLPDGALWALELHPDGDIVGKIGYTGNVFVEDSVIASVADFRRVLADTVAGELRP